MALPAPVVRTRPDRLILWPTDAGDYGIEVRWGGPEGVSQAAVVRDATRASDMPVKLRQELDGSGWTVVVGPLPRDQAARVVQTFMV